VAGYEAAIEFGQLWIEGVGEGEGFKTEVA